MYSKVNHDIIRSLSDIVGEKNIFTDAESVEKYSRDETEDFSFPPEIVIKPRNAEEISLVLKLANKYLIPVYTRGGGTGLSGGALPVYGGIVLSMENFNRILDIDKNNFQVTVESGVITQEEAVLSEEMSLNARAVPVRQNTE